MELGFDLERLAEQLGKILLAFALCFPMAWDREQSARSLGVRTFPLVAVASCAFVLVGQSQAGLGGDPQAMSRVMQGIIAGVGFLGGGAIVKQGMTVVGAATAALGVAVADGEFGVAVALGLVGFATLRWLRPLKRLAAAGKGDPIGPDSPGGREEQKAEEESDSTAARPEPAPRSRVPRRRHRIARARR